MKNLNFTYLLSTLLLLSSCEIQKDIYKNCEMPKDTLTQEEYSVALENWEECLISKRIKEKKKRKLYKDIQGNHIHLSILEGIEGEVSKTYLSFRALSKILTDKELNQNLSSSNPAIKYHSFLTLAERKRQNVFEALKTVLNDTTLITTQYGCIVEETTLADLCINQVIEKYIYNYEDEGYKTDKYQLTIEEKNELDKLVLNSNVKLNYKDYLEKNKKEK